MNDDDQPSPSTSNDTNTRNDNKKPKLESTADKQEAPQSDEDENWPSRPSFGMANASMQNEFVSMQSAPEPTEQPANVEMKQIPNTGFILYESISQATDCASILQASAGKQGAAIEFGFTDDGSCVVKINGEIYGQSGDEPSKKDAKNKASQNALDFARKIHYTIRVSANACNFLN